MFKSLISSAWIFRGLIALVACIASAWIECGTPEQFTRMDEAIRDAFSQMSVNEQAETRLTVVDIGEAALTEIGAWPWPRAKVADLADILFDHYGARAVALDVVFPEMADAKGDSRLALLANHAPLAFAQVLDFKQRDPAVMQGVLGGMLSSSKLAGAPKAYGYIANHAGFASAPCIGNIGYSPDVDGVLRRIPLLSDYQGEVFPHLSAALLGCSSPYAKSLNLEKIGVSGVWRVPYRYALSSYTVISAADVMKKQAPQDLVEGRYVLVGASALGLGDRVSTPLSSLSAGVMVHAASLSGLLDIFQGEARRAWSSRPLIIGWIVVSVVVSVVLIAKLSAWSSILMLLSLFMCWLVMAFVGVLHQAEGSISAPLVAYSVLLIVAIPHEWWRSQRSARNILNTFSHYVAKPVLNELLRSGAAYSLTPTLREVTVLIADMEGYTQTTSSLSLEDAATLTKDFLDCLTRPVLARNGTLDKYTGDGLVAFWGAPLVCPDQADQAVTAALAILEEVDGLNARRNIKGAPPIRVRIGIESGKALVGDLGTPFRSTYTAVGDCINFASRLEMAARDLPVQVVIGPVARSMLKSHKSIELGRLTLRGTNTEIDLFTVEATVEAANRDDLNDCSGQAKN